MAVCPSGHVSQTSDYCDTCGAVIGAATASEPSGAAGAAAPAGTPSAASAGAPCPSCGAAQEGRFCEECGYDFDLAALAPAAAQPSPVTTGLSSASSLSGLSGTTGLSAATLAA